MISALFLLMFLIITSLFATGFAYYPVSKSYRNSQKKKKKKKKTLNVAYVHEQSI